MKEVVASGTRDSPLLQMTRCTPTCLWNDSASVEELNRSLEFGAVGATCNPVIALSLIKKEMERWRIRVQQLLVQMPTASEEQIGWKLIEELSVRGAQLLRPVFEIHQGKNGRLSIQTDPRLYRNPEALVEQAVHFDRLAPNMIVKIPATSAGIIAVEEATYRGVSINATVSFTVPQTLAVAEAVERGLKRRERDGKAVERMGPVCTIMVGRLDDWLKVIAEKEGLTFDPGTLDWAGVAVFKKAYRLFRERGYRLRLLSAAFRNHLHWSQLVGGEVVISPPYNWQVRFNSSGIEPISRMDEPVVPEIIESLCRLADFRRAYDEDGLAPAEFDSYGATRRTLRQFLTANTDLAMLVRDLMIPNPDV